MEKTLLTSIDWLEIAVYYGLLLIIAPILGRYMARVYEGQATPFSRYFAWIEKSAYRLGGIDPTLEMKWQEYLLTVLLFSGMSIALLFLILLFQDKLPLNPQHFAGMGWLQALSTAISYATKTSWQSYAGETALSNASQMAGITVQNFASACVGNSIFLVLIRAITRNKEVNLGNFWVDFTRTLVYVLLPLSIVVAVLLAAEGTVQSLEPYVQATTLENQTQTIPLGAIASQVAIGQLGSNGEGFFNVGEAHPFANPSAFSNFIESFCILLLPVSLLFTYAQLIQSKRHGLLLLFLMLFLLVLGTVIAFWGADTPNPIFGNIRILEGMETRFGVFNSSFWMNASTGTSNGSVNAMLSSFSPAAGGIALGNMLLGELIFGGLGVGLCMMLLFVLLTVFLAGLMVGRTLDFLGKKIEAVEIRWILLAVFGPGIAILLGTAIALLVPAGVASIGNLGPHGFIEILYAFTSTMRNNGSAFASLNSAVPFYYIALSISMLLGRLAFIIPTFVIAGRLVQKRIVPKSAGTLATDSLSFAVVLLAVIFIIPKLVYGAAFFIGPLFEYLLMQQGRAF